jgi:hypothetical protein
MTEIIQGWSEAHLRSLNQQIELAEQEHIRAGILADVCRENLEAAVERQKETRRRLNSLRKERDGEF